MENKAYTTWLNNEYALWEQALNEAPFYQFKRNPQVQRMMGLMDEHLPFKPLIENLDLPWKQLEAIDQIGSPPVQVEVAGVKISGIGMRFIYYANKVLDSVQNMPSIHMAEIGGGYGGFCAIVHILARHRGLSIQEYTIYDLSPVQKFQEKYLKGIIKEYSHKGIRNLFFPCPIIHFYIRGQEPNFIMSFYAIGEFDDNRKNDYIESVISKVPAGMIIWNPHSGSSDSLDLLRKHQTNIKVQPEYPLTSPNNLQVTW